MKKIKNALLVTFDFSQRGKSGTGLAAGSLLSACYHHPMYGTHFTISHLPVQMSTQDEEIPTPEDIVSSITNVTHLAQLDSLMLACYVWSSALIEPVIKRCRELGFQGNVILGGYQIMKETCKNLYPSGDIYIPGYAENSLPEAILSDRLITKKIIDIPVNIEQLPSPYLDNTISITYGQKMIHWETRRGCVFQCNFCAHRDLKDKKVNLLAMNRIRQELDLFKLKKVKKINVLDPVFNLETNHLDILRYAISIDLKALLVFQVRFECISTDFLELCSKLNVHLEFGLQTAVKEEFKVIRRPNHLKKISKNIQRLHDWDQSFEVSLIYGLPGQTVESFLGSIDYLRSRNVESIKAFPLMLLEGTQLARDKSKFEIVEDTIDKSGIPHVVASYSFTREEWSIMQHYANQLHVPKDAT